MKYVITDNKLNFNPEQLFCIGSRDNNPKRNFLFISKLLGKHLAVSPEVVKATGYLLSSLRYGFANETYVDCIKNGTKPDYSSMAEDDGVLVLGFCETATALGMAVASSIRGSYYQASTREKILGVKRLLSFEESHSHSSTHYMFNSECKLNDFKRAILVDDEITTGNSLLNLILEIIKVSDIKEFEVMTILDWRSEVHKRQFEKVADAEGIKISVYSLLSGEIYSNHDDLRVNKDIPFISDFAPALDLNAFERVELPTVNTECVSYLRHTGMIGVKYADIENIESRAKQAAEQIWNVLESAKRVLVLGHGENIYIPSRIAAYLQDLKCEVSFRTTSRTPIYCDGIQINDAVRFVQNGDTYHFYNQKDAESFDVVVMLANNQFTHKLCSNLIIFNA